MNWSRNGAQFHQLYSTFEFFKIEIFRSLFEIERRKGEVDPSNFKIFDPLHVVLLWNHSFLFGPRQKTVKSQ